MPPTPVNTDPSSAAWMVQQITTARILEAVQVAPYLSEFRSTSPGGGSRELADFLVTSGLLTQYQAERILQGDATKLVCGPYLLTQPVGAGSLGTVFQAINRNDRRKYALKLLPLRSLWNVREAKKQLAAFTAINKHPAIVPFVDVDSAAGAHYLAWPYVAGVTLEKHLVANGPLRLREANALLLTVAEALAACHGRMIFHG
ncbi:MAG: protein kinase domain-containing protein, partial [Gemmataceae bacterium]